MADKATAVGRVIVLVGMAGLASTPAAASIARERELLQARVEAVRDSLARHPAPPTPLMAQAANWNNWPKWSKWSNWANQ